jgi:hypothetical protein
VNQSPYGLLLRFFTENPYSSPFINAPILAQLGRWGIAGLACALVAMAAGRSMPESPLTRMLQFGLAVTAMLVVAPLTQDIYCIHLAIPLLALAAMAVQFRAYHPGALVFGVTAALFYIYLSLPSLRLASHAFYRAYQAPLTGQWLLLTGLYTYCALALFAVMVAAVYWHRRRTPELSSP